MNLANEPEWDWDALERADNSRRCYDLAIKAAREKCIRSGQIQPDHGNPAERRWAAEGPCRHSELDSLKSGAERQSGESLPQVSGEGPHRPVARAGSAPDAGEGG